MKMYTGLILDLIVITISIASVVICNRLKITIIEIIQMIVINIAYRCNPEAASTRVLFITFFRYGIKVLIRFAYKSISWELQFVLAVNLMVTGTNFLCVIQIICLAIKFLRSSIFFICDRFKPDMISPLIMTRRETDDQIVSIRIACITKNVFIHYLDEAFNSTGTFIRWVRF